MTGYPVSADGRRYVCAACYTPIQRGDRCLTCWRGWIVREVDERGQEVRRHVA